MGKGFKFAIGYVLGNAMVGVVAAVLVTLVEEALNRVEGKIRSEQNAGEQGNGTPVATGDSGGTATVAPDSER